MISSSTRSGFSILDILIGIAVVGIGLIAAVGLQSSSLRANSTAERQTRAYEVAKGEIAWWLERTLPAEGGTSVTDADCESTSDNGCTVTVWGCDLETGSFSCYEASKSNVAYQVTVTYTDPRGDTVVLSSIGTGKYIDGDPTSN